MNFTDLMPEVRFALQFARQAAQVSSLVEREMVLSTLTKSDRSPVTTADFAIQALAGHLLAEAFPGDALVAEESSAMLKSGAAAASLDEVVRIVRGLWPESTPQEICEWIDYGAANPGRRYWTLDPVDGTKGFIRGDQYATALALVVDGQVELGILSCPRLLVKPGRAVPVEGDRGSVLVAQRRKGAWVASLANGQDFERLAVSSASDPARATVVRSYEDSHTDTDQLDRLMATLGTQSAPVRMDSQAKYALVAAGVADLLLRLRSAAKEFDAAKVWDHAAGVLIVEEAGGRVTDIEGKSLDFSVGRTLVRNNGVVASNSLLHKAALAGLSRITV